MSNAQDKLTLKTDEVIPVKIIRITKSKITYTKTSNAAGPEYEVDKKTVKTIAFENGDAESFVNSNSLPFEVKKSIISNPDQNDVRRISGTDKNPESGNKYDVEK